MTALPPRPGGQRRLAAVLLILSAASVLALPWNLEAFASLDDFRAACRRLHAFVGAFSRPDFSPGMLARAGGLALETAAVALLGVALGLVLSGPLALAASRSAVLGDDPLRGASRWLRPLLLQAARLLLDVLRGVPDFVWALVLSIVTGPTAITGVLAIGVSVAGILGKVLSELWDNIDPVHYQALRSTGASRLQVFLYGIQPLSARGLLSFVLMRTECAVRNASVIGVVGGGGLGAALWDEYTNLNSEVAMARMATVLLFMLALTATADLAANFLRYQLRFDPNHPRTLRALTVQQSTRRRTFGVAAVVVLLLALSLTLRDAWARAFEQPPDWGYVLRYCTELATPDLSPAMLGSALRESVVPLAVAFLATGGSILLAGALTFPAAVAFQPMPAASPANRWRRRRAVPASSSWCWRAAWRCCCAASPRWPGCSCSACSCAPASPRACWRCCCTAPAC